MKFKTRLKRVVWKASFGIPGEVGHTKQSRCPFIFLPHWRVWFDLLCLDDPVEHGGCPIGGITDQTLWLDPETLLDPVYHGLGSQGV